MTDALDHCTACGGRLQSIGRGGAICPPCYRAASEKLAASAPANNLTLDAGAPLILADTRLLVNAAGQVFLAPESVVAIVAAVNDGRDMAEAGHQKRLATLEQRNRALASQLLNVQARYHEQEVITRRLRQQAFAAVDPDGGTAQDAPGSATARTADGG